MGSAKGSLRDIVEDCLILSGVLFWCEQAMVTGMLTWQALAARPPLTAGVDERRVLFALGQSMPAYLVAMLFGAVAAFFVRRPLYLYGVAFSALLAARSYAMAALPLGRLPGWRTANAVVGIVIAGAAMIGFLLVRRRRRGRVT